MWSIHNHTPFAVEGDWVRDVDGAEVWIVAVRASFDIHPDGLLSITQEQQEVCGFPRYSNEPGFSSLIYDSDLYHCKPTTDVILHGHAYTPHGEPLESVIVTLRLGTIDKSLRVVGDRLWMRSPQGPTLTPAEKFTKMPLIYERAFGGADTSDNDPRNHHWDLRNPVGTGFAISRATLIGQQAPNILGPARARGNEPFGFGPIASHWMPRRSYAGTFDQAWEQNRFPLLPEDFDSHFYQCAPSDQQCSTYLHGGELVELENLTLGGNLSFCLPTVFLGFETDLTNRSVVHDGQLHTVILEPDYPRVTVVWHSRLPCHVDVLRLRHTTVWIRQVMQVTSGKGAH